MIDQLTTQHVCFPQSPTAAPVHPSLSGSRSMYLGADTVPRPFFRLYRIPRDSRGTSSHLVLAIQRPCFSSVSSGGPRLDQELRQTLRDRRRFHRRLRLWRYVWRWRPRRIGVLQRLNLCLFAGLKSHSCS